ncbi:T9SS type A sorting domain-containing protein [Hymenobacter metallicola]|uniref:T9SS type A sorting domain-containing protein n=1 Tax=Hymenobacter metallicola TaxID=2563114 RepID=A0A4Z0Q8H5_9BACT|nr:T9SS type A sorting domain-containing protein [Hymenobacter metallicola]TGE26387.1 T9SS type A sorting domain-containing protein [Hymenobacter metallicola]
MKRLIQASLVLALSLQATEQLYAQTVDPTLASIAIQQTGTVNNVQQQPDGKYVVGGSFTQVNGSAAVGLARLNADGSLDNSFTTLANCKSPIDKIRLLPNGQILVLGYNNITLGGRTFNTLAKLNADGSVVSGFSPGSGTNTRVNTLVVQADGKILLGGSFTSYSGVAVNRLVRLNANGSVDQAFVTALQAGFTRDNSSAAVYSVVVQPDGKILVAGNFTNYNNTGRQGLVRLNADGSLDTSFTPEATTGPGLYIVNSLALDPRTNHVLAYNTSFSSSQPIVRLTPTGALDPAFRNTTFFNCLGTSAANSEHFKVDSNGRVIVSGCYSSYGSTTDGNSFVLRLLPTGQVDPQFAVGNQLDADVNCVLVLPNDEVVLGGEFSRYGSIRNVNLVRLNNAAQALSTPRASLMQRGALRHVVPQADGKVLVGGRFWQINGQTAGNVARLNPNGTLDPSFQLDGVDGEVEKIAVRPDGRIVLGGTFARVGIQASPLVAQLLANGSPDASFAAPTYVSLSSSAVSSSVNALAVQPDGGVLVAGPVIGMDGYTAPVHRLLANGSVDGAYASAVTTSLAGFSDVYSLAVLPSGQHYIGSYGTAQPVLVRLNTNGSRDNTFTPGSSTSGQLTVLTMLPLPDDKLLVGGQFTNYNGVARTNVAVVDGSGAVDAGFVPPTLSNIPIWSVARYANGRVLLAGQNMQVNGSNRGALVRLNPNGAYDASFSNILGSTNQPRVALQANEAILVYGSSLLLNNLSTQNLEPLIRITAPNVLSVGRHQSTARTEAWPVPAHETLNLSLDAAARPELVELLDNLGRTVLMQPAPEATLALPLRHVKAGLYLLRVTYADGPVMRRVVVE